jgi:hypothetical protein
MTWFMMAEFKPRWVLLVMALSMASPQGGLAVPADEVPAQSFLVQARRVVQALEYVGFPVSVEERAEILAAPEPGAAKEKVARVQAILDSYCLAFMHISPESRVAVERGPAHGELVEKDWRLFLIKVHNEAGVTAPLRITSPQELPPGGLGWNVPVTERWLKVEPYTSRPMQSKLSGTLLEYRLVHLFSQEAGEWSAVLQFDVGQGTQDIGFRSDLPMVFEALPVAPVQLEILDEAGQPTTASLEFRDARGRIYPAQAPRLAPDFPFQPQIYRSHGQRIALPVGEWEVECRRGPEYHVDRQSVTVVPDVEFNDVAFSLERWVDPSDHGWWSGDHHIHAAGCKHYASPTQGVHPSDMILHCRGEDLKVGASLTWGPGFDYQKQFFTGREDEVSKYPYLLRYDVEVSGFGSQRSGHLCLLRLNEQLYPGGDSTEHWPSLCLNTLRWAQKQGAVCGPAHSGWGLAVNSSDLPNYVVPPFDGIGANEYIVDVTHEVEGPDGEAVPAVDFLSMVDTPYVWELNIWYHTLNCGYRARISGETDFPCIYGERVGLGRGYFKVDGKLTYDKWCQSISDGRGYVGDGLSHLIDFSVDEIEVGTGESEVSLDGSGEVTVRAKVAALLGERGVALTNEAHSRLTRDKPEIAKQPYVQKPYWHLERARVGDSRKVDVEVVVNGYPVSSKRIDADGEMRELSFQVPIERSSWVALRILPSSHTNPIWVLVDEKPVRASARSAEWCLKSVDQCWREKEKFIKQDEAGDARAAYEHARRAYRRILSECKTD